jgi:lipid-A-disaccharide synthase
MNHEPGQNQSAISLMIVAGEASGDKHGAKLVAALRALRPELDWEFFGAGGDEMRAAGVETLVDAREVAIMGVLEVAAALPKFLRAFRRLREAARQRQPRAVVLIDWSGFNLRLVKRLKRDGQRVVYYISPQIWASRSYRIHIVKRNVEKMLVILPFEREYYARAGVEVEYVGHPLLDSVRVTASREEFCARHHLDPARPLIALLPGSRRPEIKSILPPLLTAARQLSQSRPTLQFAVALAPNLAEDQRARIAEAAGTVPHLRLIENDTYNALAAAQLAVVASGTATLEAAIIGTPLMIVYRVSPLNWRLFRPMINVPFVGMPNLIAGREIAPELLQEQLTGERLAAQIAELLDDAARLERMRAELAEVRARLGQAQASERAALQILGLLEKPETEE